MNNTCFKCYERFLVLASSTAPEVYERHHKIPKACGGSNSKENIVLLSLRDHFYAHIYLTKVYDIGNDHYKMLCALTRLKGKGTRHSVFIDAELYEQAKLERSRIMSERMKGHIVSQETKAKISRAHLGMRRPEEKRLSMRKSHIIINKKPPISEETKQKYRENMLNRSWVYKGDTKRHIPTEELNQYLADGFTLGRGPNKKKMKEKPSVSNETKEKMRAHALGKVRVINTLGIKKLIYPEDLEFYADQGFIRDCKRR